MIQSELVWESLISGDIEQQQHDVGRLQINKVAPCIKIIFNINWFYKNNKV